MASTPSPAAGPPAPRPASPFADDADPRFVFRTLLGRLPLATLRLVAQARGHESEAARAPTLAGELTDLLDDPLGSREARRELSDADRAALGLFGLTEARSWPLAGLRLALAMLGVDADATLAGLARRGLLAVEIPPDREATDMAALVVSDADGELEVWAHPALTQGGRLPIAAAAPEVAGTVSRARESDGLEPVIRLAALWQRAGAGPLRRTQQGVLYKRDRERIEEGGLLAAPVDDALAELPDLPSLWMGLARRVGLLAVDRSDDSLRAAPAEFWAENALHLPQMLASAWLGLRSWDERGEPSPESPPTSDPPSACLRPAVLLRLAALDPEAWTTIDALFQSLNADAPGWDRLGAPDEAATGGRRARGGARKGQGHARAAQILERIVLGGAYALGLVRAGEEEGTRRRAVQLTPLGRYVLATGPPPPPRPSFDQFLFVQPNLEVIAYRQGLTPPIVGLLSRFAWWSRIGAAVELKLTQESVALGLESGMTAADIQEVLARHGQRALPGSVKDAVDRWAGRREQVTFHPAATLVEFSSREDRDRALESWMAEASTRRPFLAVADRYILAEDAQDVPTARISTTAARDYRLPPDRCVAVEDDGVTLTLEPSRSDLLAEAELGSFADEDRATAGRGGRRRFIVTSASLDRALDAGLTPAAMADWFRRRTGQELSPAIRLMLRSTTDLDPRPDPWPARRLLVLAAPSAETLDGVIQHPDTRDLLGERLGPTTVVVPESGVEVLRQRLARFGIAFTLP
ncbi:helicase-associated domain-containing protein [Paludisphaera sp.]|uniref:helicase-associated domain-containing protein n=1 Tax=Paludisphaera sp. TaxID=2017432 RepID=UPI00301D0A31